MDTSSVWRVDTVVAVADETAIGSAEEGALRAGDLRKVMAAVVSVGADLDLPTMLHRIIGSAAELVDARYGALGVLDPETGGLSEFVTAGIDDKVRDAIGRLPQGHGILGDLLTDGRALRIDDLADHPGTHGFPADHPPMRTFLGVPIQVRDKVFGNLYLADKRHGQVFSDTDEELVVALSAAAGMAIENARLHSQVSEIALLEDRARIARDLHDTVIQRLFATGMSLQGTARMVGSEPDIVAARIEAAVEDLDTTVKHIRAAIFGLSTSSLHEADLRARILALAEGATGALGFEPRVVFDGPVDTGLSDSVAQELLATLREALTNVARHARADSVEVSVVVDTTDVTLCVVDDGKGLSESVVRGHGLDNMESRAGHLGGSFSLSPDARRGTRLEWRVPL